MRRTKWTVDMLAHGGSGRAGGPAVGPGMDGRVVSFVGLHLVLRRRDFIDELGGFNRIGRIGLGRRENHVLLGVKNPLTHDKEMIGISNA